MNERYIPKKIKLSDDCDIYVILDTNMPVENEQFSHLPVCTCYHEGMLEIVLHALNEVYNFKYGQDKLTEVKAALDRLHKEINN